MRISPFHSHRLALVLIACGLLTLIAAIFVGFRQSIQNLREHEIHRQRVFFNPFHQVEMTLPFLHAQGSEIIYAPGQTALAFAEGFQPHEPLFVRLYSRTRGLLDAYQTRADVRGQFAAARPLSLEEDNENYTPPGGLWFQVEALSGHKQVFHFCLGKGQMPGTAETKGVYPPVAVPGTVVVFWCSGLHPGDSMIVKAAVDGQEFRPGRIQIEAYPIGPDGLLLGTLVVSLDDPTGEWRVFVNHCQLDFPVRSTLDAATVGQGVPDGNHTP